MHRTSTQLMWAPCWSAFLTKEKCEDMSLQDFSQRLYLVQCSVLLFLGESCLLPRLTLSRSELPLQSSTDEFDSLFRCRHLAAEPPAVQIIKEVRGEACLRVVSAAAGQ